ncbi:MAG: hypothetical protein QG656_2161, partial [Candidatus Hydrogenedentes bacterium]|nr:hypothetical protein [Candidatus Hydrogenedentota bacterium]
MSFAALPMLLSALGMAPALFDASADPKQLQEIHVEGLKNAAFGTVYPANSLEDGGMPLGGVGTGYLCIDTDGRFGKTSIFNRFPSPIALNQPFLSVTWGGREYVVAAA